MKRHQFVPSADRWVSVEDGTVRDLDGNELGNVGRNPPHWAYWTSDGSSHYGGYPTQGAALADLLTDENCPTPGPNRYDR